MATKAPAATKPRKSTRAAAPTPLPDAAPPSAAGELRPADRLSFLIHELSARIAALGNRHFREHGLNHFSARILVLLLEHEELRTGELVDLMVLPQSTISSQLLALQKKRLVRRRRSRKDNRSVIVSLTPAGLELARDCNALSVRAHHALLDGIPDEEREIAFGFLRKMSTRLAELEPHELVPFHPMEEVQELAALDEDAAPVRRARLMR